MKKILIDCILLLGVNIVSLNAAERPTDVFPDGTMIYADRVVVVENANSPAFEVGVAENGIAVSGVRSMDRLCVELNVSRIEPFYAGTLRKPALARLIPRMYLFEFDSKTDIPGAIAALERDPNVGSAGPSTVPQFHYQPNDPLISLQWYFEKTFTYEAWDNVRGDTTRHSIIGIIDTGVDWRNPEILPNAWVNDGEDLNHNGIPDTTDYNGVDDDGNGFYDDIVGWDFGDGDNDPTEVNLVHGTGVAGCASEATDNATLGAGMGFSARIMCLKAASGGGFPVNIWDAVVYAGDNGAQIVNCSWGTFTFVQFEQDIINALWEDDVLVIASAGASGNTPNYPAAYDHVMAVTATDQNDHKAYFAGYGTWVDISAPGVEIPVLSGDQFATMSGTSFSTAIVSGLAALARTVFPDYSNDDIELLIKESSDPIDDRNPGYEGMIGAGRINALACVTTAIDENAPRPFAFALEENYPNPFNATTVVRYRLDGPGFVTLDVYDLVGRKVKTLFRGEQQAGDYSVTWNAAEFPSGVYFARLQAGGSSQSIKMVLLK